MNEIAKYMTEHGEIELSSQIIRQYLCPNPNVTDSEVKFFLELCKAQKLNPFIKEAYLIKYGDSPAQIVTGKDVFTKRAESQPKYRGKQAGITVVDTNGNVTQREGSLVLKGETLVAGWAKVYTEGKAVPDYAEVAMSEYSSGKALWQSKPATMIRKVALVQAIREAFPNDFQGMYSPEEINTIDITTLNETPIVVEKPRVIEAPKTAEPIADEAVEEPSWTDKIKTATPIAHVVEQTAVRPNADFVPYKAGGKHKHAGKKLTEIPESFLNMVAHSEVEAGSWYERNLETKNKVIEFLKWKPEFSDLQTEPLEELPFTLDLD